MDSDNIYNFTLEVEKEDRVDKLLSSYFLEYSRSTIQKWISSNKKLIGYYQNGNKYTVQYFDMRRNIQGVGVYTTDENCQIIAIN